MPDKLRVHFESLTDRPVFHITARQLAAARRRLDRHIASRLTISRGEDLTGLERVLPRVQVLVASEFVLSHPAFPLYRLDTAAPRLRWIHVTNAGIEKLLPLDWLPRRVKLTTSSGAHFEKAREVAAMALLMLNVQMPRMLGNQMARRWEKVMASGIGGKTLCIVGVGALGQAFATEGKRLGMTVVGVRRSGKAAPNIDRMYKTAGLARALKLADFVVVATPLTAETHNLIGAAEFARMKPGAAFINVARARVVDYKALQASLRSGALSGAMVDVFHPEPPPPDSDLWHTPNLIMTPHVLMDDAATFLGKCIDIGFDNVARDLAGRPLRNVIDPVLGY